MKIIDQKIYDDWLNQVSPKGLVEHYKMTMEKILPGHKKTKPNKKRKIRN